MQNIIDRLRTERTLSQEDWVYLLENYQETDVRYAAELAREIARQQFGKQLFFRGIIEFTNYCKNDCYYCGLRCSARETVRYRLTAEEILLCCQEGYALGYRTFVLQGGEDGYFTDDRLCEILRDIKRRFPDVAITLSVGERTEASYRRLFAAGADRYLLRHETANAEHYGKLHPSSMSFAHRMDCLRQLKAIGYQTGCGMMIGSPHQTAKDLAQDLRFLAEFQPDMIGIGPFRSHHDTPFRDFPNGSTTLTLFVLSLCRIMLPTVLLPATTALDCDGEGGRQAAILAGANVVMPNLSPQSVRKSYLLYDDKPGVALSASENLELLRRQVEAIGYTMVVGRGDRPKEERQ